MMQTLTLDFERALHLAAFFGTAKHQLSVYLGRVPASPDSVQIDFDKPVKVGNSLSENEPIKLFLVHHLHPLCHRMFRFRLQRDFIPPLDHRFCWLRTKPSFVTNFDPPAILLISLGKRLKKVSRSQICIRIDISFIIDFRGA
jgi:hypothetical protein